LNVKEQKEVVDVTRKVFVRLDRAACPCGVISRRKFGSATLTFAAIVVVYMNTVRARSEATASIASGRITIFLVRLRHVAAASKARKVDAPAACDRKSVPRVLTRQLRSAQIRHAVSVPQGSLIRQACRYVRWACVNVV
jgi:hypothetical protein